MEKNVQILLNYQKSLAYVEELEFEKALSEINAALKYDEQPILLLAKGKILAQQKRFQQAIETLQQIPESSAEYDKAKRVIKRIKKIRNPVVLFLHGLSISKWLATISLLVIIILSVGVISNYFSNKQQIFFNQQFNKIQKQTEQTAIQLHSLSNRLETKDFAERKDLLLQQKIITDSFATQINDIEKTLNKTIQQNASQAAVSLDSIKTELKKLLRQSAELKQQLLLEINEIKRDKKSIRETQLEQQNRNY